METNETEWVLVETVSQFAMQYMVQVPKGEKDWALDTVTCQEAKEFGQKYLGETIISHRVVTKEEALVLSDAINDYTTSWNDEQKIEAFFTHWKDYKHEE